METSSQSQRDSLSGEDYDHEQPVHAAIVVGDPHLQVVRPRGSVGVHLNVCGGEREVPSRQEEAEADCPVPCVRMADVAGLVGTKGIALGRRYEEKDNYDLYAVIANYGDGPVELADLVRPFTAERLLRSSLEKIREWYRDVDAAGPAAVAGFFPDERGDARLRRIRDAFETVDRFPQELRLQAASTQEQPVRTPNGTRAPSPSEE